MPDRDPEKQREYRRRYRAKRLARGQCGRCNNPRKAGRVLCVNCAEEGRRRMSDIKAQGLCVSCLDAAALPEQTMCSDCLVRMRDYSKKRYKRHKAQGLCIDCGNPARPARVHCAPCAARAIVHATKSNRKQRAAKRKRVSDLEKQVKDLTRRLEEAHAQAKT